MKSDVVIISPCFNESDLIISFLNLLEAELHNLDRVFRIVLVDDGSTDNTVDLLQQYTFQNPNLYLDPIRLRVVLKK